MKLITEHIEKALTSLKEAWVEYQKDVSNTFVRDSVIQRFEYTYELSHKILRRFLAETESSKSDISEMFFNDLIRLGCKRGLLLNDLESWDKYRKARNLTSHNYDELNAKQILVIIPLFIEEIDYELAKIKEKLNQHSVLLHIDENHLTLITSLIKNIPEINNCPVFIYGSRVQGKSTSYSDVDIALDYHGEPVPENIKAALLSAFEISTLPYSVDIVDLSSISPAFRATIEKDFVKLI